MHRAVRGERRAQRRMIEIPQVAAKPDQSRAPPVPAGNVAR